ARRHARGRTVELHGAALRDRPGLRHARQRGEGRALPAALRRARAASGRRLSLRDRLVLSAQEEVDQGAPLVRSRARIVPDLSSLPVPPRVLPREAASTPGDGGGARAGARHLGEGAERAAATRPWGPSAGAVPPVARAARSRRV